jgi:hypothetical protein
VRILKQYKDTRLRTTQYRMKYFGRLDSRGGSESRLKFGSSGISGMTSKLLVWNVFRRLAYDINQALPAITFKVVRRRWHNKARHLTIQYIYTATSRLTGLLVRVRVKKRSRTRYPAHRVPFQRLFGIKTRERRTANEENEPSLSQEEESFRTQEKSDRSRLTRAFDI